MSLNTLDKYLQATPATVKKGNLKRTAVEDVISITTAEERITDKDECCCDDVELDMDDDDLLEFTQQAYCTQADLLDETESEFEDDGMTQTHDFTQQEEEEEEEIIVSAMQQELLKPRKNAFHKDTEQQVSINVMGIQRIFKLGESFMSNVKAGKLCKENNVPDNHVEDAIYTIRKFYTDTNTLKKTADCRVRIPVYDTLPTLSETRRLKRHHPNKYVTLAKTERIALSKLDKLIIVMASSSSSSTPNGLLKDELLYSVELKSSMYSIAFEEPRGVKSFDMMEGATPTVLDIFAGCGGMSTGFERAKFHVKWMVEMNPQAASTLKLNHRRHGRVYAETTESFLNKAKAGLKLYPLPHEVHHVHASSPCQGMHTKYDNDSTLVS